MNSELLDLYVKMLKIETTAWREKKMITDVRPLHHSTGWMVSLLGKGYTEDDLCVIDKEYRKKAYEILKERNEV